MFFRIFLLVLILFCSGFAYSQQNENEVQDASATIALKSGARIFSADKSFNQQIHAGNIVLKNSEVSYQKNLKKQDYLQVAAKQSKVEKKKREIQFVTAANQIQKESIKKAKNEIEKYEKRKKSFEKIDFQNFPSPNQFFSSNTVLKNYVVPSQNSHDSFKSYVLSDAYILKRALDFLHSQQYTCYNSKSLDFCFSEVFSVRPPPMF